jgi:2-polyprenyl-3-methyl-5-hydroxy-6-metoxy-1,4-benzoquinol methylase
MKKSTIELLRCPLTNTQLEIVDAVYDSKGDSVSGFFRGGGRSYKIEDGFLDFINEHRVDSKIYGLAQISYVDKLINIGWNYEEISVMDGLRYNINKLLENYLYNYVKGRVLEIGAGGNFLKEKFAKMSYDWISTDYDMRSRLDIRCDGMSLPFVDESVDVIVCIDVLEHVAYPELMVSEFSHVLSKGGVLILSTPFFFYLHEAPNDFHRFSKYG